MGKSKLYEIVSGKYIPTTGKVREVHLPGARVVIPVETAKRMGKMVKLIADSDGSVQKKKHSKPSKVIIPPARDEKFKPPVRSKKLDETPADEQVAEKLQYLGGGYYTLTDGSKVQGKANAIEAQRLL